MEDCKKRAGAQEVFFYPWVSFGCLGMPDAPIIFPFLEFYFTEVADVKMAASFAPEMRNAESRGN